MSQKIKPIIGRIGGKWRISNWILQHITRFDWSLYVEPFCGSAAVYFQLLNNNIPETIKNRGCHFRAVLNDLDSKIINLYRVCRDFPELLAYAVYFTPYSREEHRNAQKGEAVDDLIEMCNRFLVDNWQSQVRDRRNQLGIQNGAWGLSHSFLENGASITPKFFDKFPCRILTASQHLGQQFNELREGINAIPDETLRQQSQEALNAILSEVQKTLETDIRVEFVRRFLTYEYQERKGRHFNDDLHNYWGIENNNYDNKHQPTNFNKTTEKITTASPHLQEISELKKVYLENDDFEKVCRRWDTGHSLHYLDAPYYGKEDYYQEKFTKECHLRLCQMAHELEGQVIISYYPHPDILAMYSENDWEMVFKDVIASSAGVTRNSKTKTRPKRTEMLLIRKNKNPQKTIIDLSGQMRLF